MVSSCFVRVQSNSEDEGEMRELAITMKVPAGRKLGFEAKLGVLRLETCEQVKS
jgi:hypothetical protein